MKLQFLVTIFGCGAKPAPGSLEFWKPPKKLANWVVITDQLLTQNQNFQNISVDNPLRMAKNVS